MITTMEADECGVEECKSPVTFLDYLTEWPKQPIKPKVENFGKEPKMSRTKKDTNLESKHLKG